MLGLLLVVAIIVAFFFYEDHDFNSYVSHQHGADMVVPINANAPVKSSYEVEIGAPVDTVWKVLTQIDKWPSWQKNVTETTLMDRLEQGNRFKWKAGGLSFDSRIHTMKNLTMFGWTGKTLGASAIHNWTFQEGTHLTKVSVEESLQGIFPRFFRQYFQHNLDEGMKINLQELKTASESKMI